MASQFHRPDLNEGMILAFRHARAPTALSIVALHGVDLGATDELSYDVVGTNCGKLGVELMRSFELTWARKRSSELIVYRKVAE